MMKQYTAINSPTMRILTWIFCISLAPSLVAQEIVDRFNRANNNLVGGGWTETESSNSGAVISGNQLVMSRTANANQRQYVTQTTPGGYSTTLGLNNCTLTWAFSMRASESETELAGFDVADDGIAVILAGSSSDFTTGTGYAVVLGETGNTDRIRLVRYNGGLDADVNITNVIIAGDFANEYLDVRVTFVPSTNTWNLFYRSNGNTRFGNPLTASTSAGSVVDATYTGTSLPIIGALWNHDGDNGESARFDNFHVPNGAPSLPVITPSSATICVGSAVDLVASSTSGRLARSTFNSTGGPSTVTAVGANDGSVYPWGITVSGLPTSGVTVESVTLNGITHTYPDDLDVLLQSATGTNVVLMSDVGGGGDISGNTYTIMDGESAFVDEILNNSGNYAPTNSGTPDTWPTAPGPGSITQTTPTLSLFTGNFNGTWNLLIRDDANTEGGSITSWSITFTYASTVSYTWAPATGLSTTTSAFVTASPITTQAYTVTTSHPANACTTVGNITVTVITSPCVYYSRATGNVLDPIWSDTPSGIAGPATFGAGVGMVVQSGDVVTNTVDEDVMNLTVDAGGTLVLDPTTQLTASGSAVVINGALTANDDSELRLNSTSATSLTLAGAKSFWDLSVNTSAGTTLTGVAHIRGTLQLDNGVFAAGTGQLVLRSTATETGRLGPVAATASYTGTMRIERYVPAGATNWRLLGSSIASRKVNHWMDDFTTAGFPGSHVPWFDQPVGSGILWPSVRRYDETNPGAGANDGMVGVSSNAQNLTVGWGFAAWCGDNLFTTNAFVIDLENQSPIIASTPVTLPMTYTNTGNPTVDGWNLASNPVPSPIAFDQIARGADVADYITYYDPATGNTATWDISLNAGTNGGTNTIQSSQGFFLKATGPLVTTTVSESDKVEDNSGGFFGLPEDGPAVLRLEITSEINSFSDETLIVFSEGTPATDGDDVPKYIFGTPDAPQIASMGEAGALFAINAYGPYTGDIAIPIMVDAGVSGEYTVTASGLVNLGLSCLRIEDLLTNTITPLAEGATYSFEMDALTDPGTPRLMLHASAPLAFMVSDVTCNGLTDGSATVVVVGGPVDLVWMNDVGETIMEQSDVEGEISMDGLGFGDHQLTVNGVGGCGALTQLFQIGTPAPLVVEASITDASCPGSMDGGIVPVVEGGTAPFTFAWNTGSTETELLAGAGEYYVVVTDVNGCTLTSETFTIAEGPAPIASAYALSTTVLVNTAVVFVNNSTPNASYSWDFGDGASSTDPEPEHSYALPGAYTVMLTVVDHGCTASTTLDITVETNTGVAEAGATVMNAYVSGEHFIIEHSLVQESPIVIQVFNATGQKVIQQRAAGTPGRVTVPTSRLTTGIWFVQVSTEEFKRTFALPVVR